jgi:hypothetical protein
MNEKGMTMKTPVYPSGVALQGVPVNTDKG